MNHCLDKIRQRLISRLESEQLWGFDHVTQVIEAILTHEDYAYRWQTSAATIKLADIYRRIVLAQVQKNRSETT